jgi:hypothetical protein
MYVMVCRGRKHVLRWMRHGRVGNRIRSHRIFAPFVFLLLAKARGSPAKAEFVQATNTFIRELILISLLTERELYKPSKNMRSRFK